MRTWVAVMATILGCSDSSNRPAEEPTPAGEGAPVVISVVGTNDLHGHIEQLPLLGGYLANLRAARQDDGAVLLVDAGDMFQGTLASNLGEGEAVVEAYAALGYAAVTIGNHEFDYGPVGDESVPQGPEDDPRGALKARARQAGFPFLAANLIHEDGRELDWPNVHASVTREVADVPVGIIGVTSAETLRTTMAANVRGLAVEPLAREIAGEARALREAGAAAVVVLAHAGGACHELDDPDEPVDDCRMDAEIVQVARDLPEGLVDVIVAGHTHQGMAHRIAGIPIIESYAHGRTFGRVDLRIESGRVASARLHRPRNLCPGDPKAAPKCDPGSYEGRPVEPDPRIAEVVAPARERARELREQSLGVVAEEPIRRAYDEESALGNLFTDLMLAARPGADVALTNGGGLRADIPAGPVTYGELHQAMPFDNRFATVRLTGAQLRRLIAGNLRSDGGFLSLGGARVKARCRGGDLRIALFRDGEPIGDDQPLTLVTSDFLASGDTGAIARLDLPDDAIEIHDDGPTIRDAMAEALREREHLRFSDRPRVAYPGDRPVRCR